MMFVLYRGGISMAIRKSIVIGILNLKLSYFSLFFLCKFIKVGVEIKLMADSCVAMIDSFNGS